MKGFWNSFVRHFHVWPVAFAFLYVGVASGNDKWNYGLFPALFAGVLIGFAVVRFTRCYNEFSAELPWKACASLIIAVPFSIIGILLFLDKLDDIGSLAWAHTILGLLFPRWKIQARSEQADSPPPPFPESEARSRFHFSRVTSLSDDNLEFVKEADQIWNHSDDRAVAARNEDKNETPTDKEPKESGWGKFFGILAGILAYILAHILMEYFRSQ
jgi:hypothetical protein